MSEFLRQCSLCHPISTPSGPSAVPADPGAQLVAQASKTLQEILDGIDQVHQSILQIDALALQAQPPQQPQDEAQLEEARRLRGAGRAWLRVVT